MRLSYEEWAAERLREKSRCRVERSMTCIPLRSDPICRACHESDQVRPGAGATGLSERPAGGPARGGTA
jgi:hypothetical protein